MSDRQTFADRVLAGKVIDLDTVDDDVSAWHRAKGAGCALHEWLGFSREEYSLFVEQPDSLRTIFAARHFGMDITDLLRKSDSAVLLAARGASPEETTSLVQWLKKTGRM